METRWREKREIEERETWTERIRSREGRRERENGEDRGR